MRWNSMHDVTFNAAASYLPSMPGVQHGRARWGREKHSRADLLNASLQSQTVSCAQNAKRNVMEATHLDRLCMNLIAFLDMFQSLLKDCQSLHGHAASLDRKLHGAIRYQPSDVWHTLPLFRRSVGVREERTCMSQQRYNMVFLPDVVTLGARNDAEYKIPGMDVCARTNCTLLRQCARVSVLSTKWSTSYR